LSQHVACRHCGGELSAGGWWAVHRKFHEAACKGATDEERAYWKRLGRWPWHQKESARKLQLVVKARLAEGQCRACENYCDENPRTGEPYRNCNEHRRYYRVRQRGIRKAAKQAQARAA
jgi:hypothetical protein